MSTTHSIELDRPTAVAAVDSPNAKLVTLYLETVGEGTAEQLQSDLGLSKLSLLSILSTLERRGLVERDTKGTINLCDAQ
ncbi:TrmB family transcriptional regulator [Haloarchaeobius sp. TZWWS8]|uniref:TrmB family transcriptional regulator n=1 Tax=Haloarchaeobius sp. TZWWS8 TaxID=3446121 RepID=UPI003EB972E0